jgi:hypothetical protein
MVWTVSFVNAAAAAEMDALQLDMRTRFAVALARMKEIAE